MNRPFDRNAFAARVTRRAFLGRGAGVGLGGFALANLLYPHMARGAAAPSSSSAGSAPAVRAPPRWRGC